MSNDGKDPIADIGSVGQSSSEHDEEAATVEVRDEHYEAVENAYAESARAVRWAYVHWALDAGIESALKDAMGHEVSKAMVGLLHAVEALLKDGGGPPKPKLALRAEDYDPDEKLP